MAANLVPASERALRPNQGPRKDRGLRELRGVGPCIENDLRRLGVSTVEGLAQRDGTELYEELCALTECRQDPCVLDTFRCAVAQARDPELPEEQRNWWWWSRKRKLASGRTSAH